MIKYDIEGVDSLLKTLRQKRRVYSYYKQRILRNASKLGMRITEDKWFGIDDSGIAIKLIMESNGFIIEVSGTQVLFLEFGAGKTYEDMSHPLADDFGYGPGTYSMSTKGMGHWNDPNGWYYYSNDPTKVVAQNYNGMGVAHSYGNVAWAATYNSAVIMREEFKAMVIKELLRE